MLTPLEQYQALIASGNYKADQYQEKIILSLNDLYLQLTRSSKNCFFRPCVRGKNIYIWGNVGRGKTWLMDLFFHALPLQKKQRCHFHAFMKDIHTQLQQKQGQINPLLKIAKELSKKIHILCLDEFFVSDIADAMILGKLLSGFFKYKIILILTSNHPPDQLYFNGLQRELFLPAIALIHQYMQILRLESTQDYRLRYLKEEKETVFIIDARENTPTIRALFLKLAHSDPITENQAIIINHRRLPTKAFTPYLIWFDIYQLCAIPRSQLDYLCIAKQYKIIFLDNLSLIDEQSTNFARYLINLIDIIYDAKRLLVLHSRIPLSALYPKGALMFEFQRTLSRLHEMQSKDYIKKAQAL